MQCLLKIIKYYTLLNIKNFIKAPIVIDADLECLIEKIDGCKNNPENSFAAKASKHIPSGFSISMILSFKRIKNKRAGNEDN